MLAMIYSLVALAMTISMAVREIIPCMATPEKIV
jgi:hypothetical protein